MQAWVKPSLKKMLLQKRKCHFQLLNSQIYAKSLPSPQVQPENRVHQTQAVMVKAAAAAGHWQFRKRRCGCKTGKLQADKPWSLLQDNLPCTFSSGICLVCTLNRFFVTYIQRRIRINELNSNNWNIFKVTTTGRQDVHMETFSTF